MTQDEHAAQQDRFAQVLAQAIDRSGLSLADISQRLGHQGQGVSPATLSYWKNGLRTPTRRSSQAVVEALEGVLELPAGTLSNTLADSPQHQRHPLAGLPTQPGLTDTLTALGTSLDWQPMPHVIHTHVAIGQEQVWTALTQALVFDPPRADTRSVPLLVPVPHGTRAVVVGQRGCHLSQPVVLDDDPRIPALLVLRADLYTSLGRGQLAALEYQLHLSGAAGAWLATAVPSRTPLLGLHATFLDTAPGHAHYTAVESPTRTLETRLPLTPGHDVQHTIQDAHPGLHTLHWTNTDF